MVSAPETLRERFDRVFREQKSSLVVSADDYRVDEHGVYHSDGTQGLIGWRMALEAFETLLPTVEVAVALAGAPGAGKSTWAASNRAPGVLYLDAMLARRRVRREVCEMAAAAGTPIDCVFVDSDLETCLERNRRRAGARRVPEQQVRRAHHRLAVCPPGGDEGWRRVLKVSRGLGLLSGRTGGHTALT
jgi:hypothetical protein